MHATIEVIWLLVISYIDSSMLLLSTYMQSTQYACQWYASRQLPAWVEYLLRLERLQVFYKRIFSMGFFIKINSDYKSKRTIAVNLTSSKMLETDCLSVEWIRIYFDPILNQQQPLDIAFRNLSIPFLRLCTWGSATQNLKRYKIKNVLLPNIRSLLANSLLFWR